MRSPRRASALFAVALVVSTSTASQALLTNPVRARQWASAARTEVTTAHDLLLDWLAGSPHLQEWRNYLASHQLEEQLRRGDAADPAVVSHVLSRYSSGTAALEDRRFVAVR